MKIKVLAYSLMVVLLLVVWKPEAKTDEAAIKQAIAAVLNEQAAGWNEGSVEKYMQGYEQTENIRFASGGSITYGWQTVMERYKKRYTDKATMGKLTFKDVDINVISPDSALVFGHWQLDREKDQPSGLFTLLMRKTAAGWRIVHDHTSSAQ
jgi:ketosteroid isomerase-like protein